MICGAAGQKDRGSGNVIWFTFFYSSGVAGKIKPG